MTLGASRKLGFGKQLALGSVALVLAAGWSGADEKQAPGPPSLPELVESLSAGDVGVRMKASQDLDGLFDGIDSKTLGKVLTTIFENGDPEIREELIKSLKIKYWEENFVTELGFLGIRIGRGFLEGNGVVTPVVKAEDVVPGGPAAAAGVKAGDLITAIDGREISGNDCENRMRNAIATKGAGSLCKFRIARGEEQLLIEVNLAPRDRFVDRGRDFIRPLTTREKEKSFSAWLEERRRELEALPEGKEFLPTLESDDPPMIQLRNPFRP